MASAAVQLDEESLIREFVAQMTLPVGVTFKRVDQAIDSSGEPALRVLFAVSMKLPLSKKRVNALSDLKNELQDKIFRANLPKWPYVSFVEVK